MNEVTRILSQIEAGDPSAADALLPLVYEELRKLSAQKLAQERAGQTLQPTALVHEAYLRLVDEAQAQHWDSRGHFFMAAAEAMRRILIENARRKATAKRGGGRVRRPLDEVQRAVATDPGSLLELDEALSRLEEADSTAARLVKLRFFGDLTMQQAAEVLGVSERTAYYAWTYARSWLACALSEEGASQEEE